VLSHFATNEKEKERLEDFAAADGADERYRYCNREHRSALDVNDDTRTG
jgi:sulfite reductase alpha subunit-like flavoprotein